MRLLIAVALSVVFFACQGKAETKAGAEGKAAGAQEEKGDKGQEEAGDKLYTVSLTPAELKAGESAELLLQIKPVSGYHWNLEYPTAFKAGADSGVEVEKGAFSVADGSITASDDGADIPVKVKAKSGATALELTGNFSLCQETSCKIFRNEKLSVPITVK